MNINELLDKILCNIARNHELRLKVGREKEKILGCLGRN